MIFFQDLPDEPDFPPPTAQNATSPRHPKPFVTNEATVMASLLSGMGPYSFNDFCESLEMPGLHQKTFNNIAKRLYSQNERLADQVFSKAATFVLGNKLDNMLLM